MAAEFPEADSPAALGRGGGFNAANRGSGAAYGGDRYRGGGGEFNGGYRGGNTNWSAAGHVPSFSYPGTAAPRTNYNPAARTQLQCPAAWAERANSMNRPNFTSRAERGVYPGTRPLPGPRPTPGPRPATAALSELVSRRLAPQLEPPVVPLSGLMVDGRIRHRRRPEQRHALVLGLLALLQPLLHGPGSGRRHDDRLFAAHRPGGPACRRFSPAGGGGRFRSAGAAAAGRPGGRPASAESLDAARAAFAQGDYAAALAQCDKAIAQAPDDVALHEFRGLDLFALQRYKEAAGTIYAVLSVGPGWDWTTLSGFYPDDDVYTEQLRALEQFVNANRNEAYARFLLAYQYLICGHTDAAAAQLKAAVELNPKDELSAQLLSALETTKAPVEAAPQRAAPARRSRRAGRTMDRQPSGRRNHLA